MFLQLTENYISSKFYQYCGKPGYNRAQRVYQGSCPICREGSSWLRKRRCYYLTAKNAVCCHNCGWYSSPYQWIQKVSGMNYAEIKKEIDENTFNDIVLQKNTNTLPVKILKPQNALPDDSINLNDEEQIDFYKNNETVQKCLRVIKERRLDTAINKPACFYTTIIDKVHINRLIIPFFDVNNKVVWYQSRKIFDSDDRPKYLSKVNSERALYGVNNIDENYGYIFITEGPIDSMFIKNGVAVAGINEGDSCFTGIQNKQLSYFPLHEKIWVLDNQLQDSASKIKTKKLLDKGERVFIWPEAMKDYKDLNEYCIDQSIDSINPDIILKNSYQGLRGKLLASL